VQAPPPTEVYATLTGLVDGDMTRRVFAGGSVAMNAGIKKLHLLIQSTGGFVGEGIGIYNYLRALPIELVTYNGGIVSSIAVLVYLAGKVRNVSKTATFMIHKSTYSFGTPTTAERLKLATDGLLVEDARSEAILWQHVNLPSEKREIHERGDLTLTAEESVKFGLAHGIAGFAVPPGFNLFNL
jgi:ATP-dependent Clp protease protease subunit